MTATSRGDVWLVDLPDAVGREQRGRRPALVISTNELNYGPSTLLIVIPITSTDRRIRAHVSISPPEGGLKKKSFIMSENVRSISKKRLVRRLGGVTNATLAEVEDRLRILMDL